MRTAATAESILIKFCTSTPWGDVVMYLKRHPNWSKGLGGEGCEISPIPLTLPLTSNTAYCATAHTRDISFFSNNSHFLWPACVADADIIFSYCFMVTFFLVLTSFFFPRLISAVTDWMSTILSLMDGVALVRI